MFSVRLLHPGVHHRVQQSPLHGFQRRFHPRARPELLPLRGPSAGGVPRLARGVAEARLDALSPSERQEHRRFQAPPERDSVVIFPRQRLSRALPGTHEPKRQSVVVRFRVGPGVRPHTRPGPREQMRDQLQRRGDHAVAKSGHKTQRLHALHPELDGAPTVRVKTQKLLLQILERANVVFVTRIIGRVIDPHRCHRVPPLVHLHRFHRVHRAHERDEVCREQLGRRGIGAIPHERVEVRRSRLDRTEDELVDVFLRGGGDNVFDDDVRSQDRVLSCLHDFIVRVLGIAPRVPLVFIIEHDRLGSLLRLEDELESAQADEDLRAHDAHRFHGRIHEHLVVVVQDVRDELLDVVRKQPLTQRRERDGNAHHHVLLLVLEQVHDLVHVIWEHAIGHPLERRDGGANHAFRIVLESLADGKHLVFVQARLVEDAHRA